MAKKQADGVRKWLEMWSAIDPANPLIPDWQLRLSLQNPLLRLIVRRKQE